MQVRWGPHFNERAGGFVSTKLWTDRLVSIKHSCLHNGNEKHGKIQKSVPDLFVFSLSPDSITGFLSFLFSICLKITLQIAWALLFTLNYTYF